MIEDKIKTVDICLQNCYGIKRLKQTFRFDKNNVFLIYAKNAVMKTSFLKTFKDFQRDRDSLDIRLHIKGKRVITGIKKQNVITFSSYEDNKFLYTITSFYNSLDRNERNLIKGLKQQLSFRQYTNGPEEEKLLKEMFLFLLFRYYQGRHQFGNIELIQENIIGEPIFLVFDFESIKTSLNNQGYQLEEISGFEEDQIEKLEIPVIDKLFLRFLRNINIVDSISQRINISDFALITEDREKYIVTLLNYLYYLLSADEFRKDFATKQFLRNFAELNINIFNISAEFFIIIKKQKEIFESIASKSYVLNQKLDQKLYNKLTSQFNEYFKFPFKLSLKLNGELGYSDICFTMPHSTGCLLEKQTEVSDTLSQGEKRAVYLLKIFFEIEMLDPKQEYLLIFDDIVDSFDYQNKYAITSYLYEISQKKNLKLIILTHNYDFFRLLSRKLNNSARLLFTIRDSSGNISFNILNNIEGPWQEWKRNINTASILALIPFIRNIIEYKDNDKNKKEYLLLTHLLHIKKRQHYEQIGWLKSTQQITFKDIQPIFQKELGIKSFPKSIKLNQSVYQSFKNFHVITKDNGMSQFSLDLLNKIIYTIKLRLEAEEYLYQLLPGLLDNFNPTRIKTFGQLYGKFLNWFFNNASTSERELYSTTKSFLNKISIITPEHIHINSFMYEPLIDTELDELIELDNKFNEIKKYKNKKP